MAIFSDHIPKSMHPEVQKFLATQQGLRIGGTQVVTDTYIPVENPSTGEIIGKISIANMQHINQTVTIAQQAFDTDWGQMSGQNKGILLWKLAEELKNRAEIFAELDSLDTGKPVHIARDIDVVYSVKHLQYFAGWSSKIEGQTIPVGNTNRFNYTVQQPVGVCALITPWNYPLLMLIWKLAPALSAGNTVILKPAEQTSLSALYLADMALQIGFPLGVINVLTGYGKNTGKALASHNKIHKVAFTGSTGTGRDIVGYSAGNLKKVSLELGGKAGNIIFADADLQKAISGAFWAGFGNNGQSCTAGARLFVQKPIYDSVINGLIDLAKTVKVGPGFSDFKYDLGPVISQQHMEKILNYITTATAQGARVNTGGHRLGNTGYFIAPTLITEGTDDMAIMREELFGPVLCVSVFDTESEVINRVNDTVYGLATGFWTQDINRVMRLTAALNAGTVWINCWGDTDPGSPFGGMGMSGYGREMGKQAFELYTQTKSIWIHKG